VNNSLGGGERRMFAKEEIDKAIEVVKEKIDYIKMTNPYGTTEIDVLESMILSLEGYLDREEIIARYIEWQKQYELARCDQFGRRL
jgi:prefoldin subunit 5